MEEKPQKNNKKIKESIIEDQVNRPDHYHSGGIDLFEFGEQKFSKEEMIGFYKLNVMKYLVRAGKKDNVLQDLKKAKRYLEQLIELECK